jgi:predicted transcriptional regulator
MARPRGRTKPARLTVNLDRPTYRSVVELARREDVSVSWVVRRAIEGLLARDRAAPVAPTLESTKGERDRTRSGEMVP